MNAQIKDGGSAFPVTFIDGPSGQPCAVAGMTLHDYFVAHAPSSEIEGIIPSTVKDISGWLGIAADYDFQIHWPMALAKARGIWADAMLAAREVQQ